MHPLDDALARVNRAQEHLAQLIGDAFLFSSAEKDSTVVSYDPQAATPAKLTLSYPDSRPPVRLSILVGETVYNLRAALDYLVYALARHDSGKPQRGTQFPIEDTPEGFAVRKDPANGSRCWLRGVNAAHIAQIERLQPYNGCDWTRALRTLSNPDKHRNLIVTKSQLRGVQIQITDGTGDIAGAVTSAHDSEAGVDMYVKADIRCDVAFNDGTSILMLEILESQVAKTLEAFKPEF